MNIDEIAAYADTELHCFVTYEYIKNYSKKDLLKYEVIHKIWNGMSKDEREEVLSQEPNNENSERIFNALYYNKITYEYIKETKEMGTNIDRILDNGEKEDGRVTCMMLLLTRFIELVTLYRVTKYTQENVNPNYYLRNNPGATHLSQSGGAVSTEPDFVFYNGDFQSDLYVEQQQIVIKKYMNKEIYLHRLIFKASKFFNYKDNSYRIRHLLTLLVEQEDGTYKIEYYMYKIKEIINDWTTDRIWITQKRISEGRVDLEGEYYKIYEKFGRHSLVFIENMDLEKYCTQII